MSDVSDDPRLGTEVGPYAIARLVGKGGMGAVYEARHTRLARRFAIKFLLPELAARPEILRRFENEAVAAGSLEHPNLVAVTDLGRATDGAPYLVMEYLQGEDAARLLQRAGPLPAPRAADIVLQACRGIAVVHAAGIVHRDLKPENLFVTKAGDGSDLVKVVDFGIAKLRPSDGQVGTRTGSTMGTAHYMSPEQARGAGEVDAQADVWSLGVVLYELLGGRRPFAGDDFLNVVHQILSAEPEPLDALRPNLPRGLTAVVARAMAKEPGARFPTVEALAKALTPFAGRTGTSHAPRSASITADGATSTPEAYVAGDAATRTAPVRRWRRAGMAFAFTLAAVAFSLIFNARPQAPTATSVAVTPEPPRPAAPPPPPPAVAPAALPAPEPARPDVRAAERERSDKRRHGEPRPRTAAASGVTPPVGRAITLDPNPY
jgi:serine/threonine-protein kinase